MRVPEGGEIDRKLLADSISRPLIFLGHLSDSVKIVSWKIDYDHGAAILHPSDRIHAPCVLLATTKCAH